MVFPHPPLPCPSVHARREPAEKSYPPRPGHDARRSARGSVARAGLRSVPAAARPELPLLALPRRLQHPAAETRGNRRKVAPVGAAWVCFGPPSRPGPGRGAGRGAGPPSVRGALGPARGVQLPGGRAESSEPSRAERELRLLRRRRRTVAEAAPKYAEGGAMRRGRLWGSLVPGAERREPSPSPTFRAGRTPAARPRRKIRMEGGPGKAAGGFSTR